MSAITAPVAEIPATVTVSGETIYKLLLDLVELRAESLDHNGGETVISQALGEIAYVAFSDVFGATTANHDQAPLYARFNDEALERHVDYLLDEAASMIDKAKRLQRKEVENLA